MTAGPYDVWHSEEYLIAALVKTHGWHWLKAGVLARGWKR